MGGSGPIVFQQTEKQIIIAPDGIVNFLECTNRIDSFRCTLPIVSFSDAQKLVKDCGKLYSAGQGLAPQADTTSRVNQGYVEKSNVNFFFSSRRRHTRFDCDWSSDVCSSDLTSRAASPACAITPSALSRNTNSNSTPRILGSRPS